jgi:hypothetical protein
VSRLGLVLGPDSAEELNRRLSELTHEFQERSPEPGGEPFGVFVAVHERKR